MDWALIAVLLGIGGVLWRGVTWIYQLRADIDSLRTQIAENVRDDEARDEALRREFRREMAAEKTLIMSRLDAHEKEDSRMATDIREMKSTLNDMWATISRMDKCIAAIKVKVDQ